MTAPPPSNRMDWEPSPSSALRARARGDAPASRRSSRPPPPLGVVVSSRDFLAPVSGLDRDRAPWARWMKSEWLVWSGWLLCGMIAFGIPTTIVGAKFWFVDWTMFHWLEDNEKELLGQINSFKVFDIDVAVHDPEPTPPPPKVEPDPEPKPVVEEKPAAIQHEMKPTGPAAPLAAAAGKIIASDEVVDLTKDDPYATGKNDVYQGGVTSSDGTGLAPGRKGARADGAPNGTGKSPAPSPTPTAVVAPPPRPNLARAAKGRSSNWNCPFPPEADTAQINDAVATVLVLVRPDGTPASVQVTRDPGNGFGRMASQCAMRERYNPALNEDGQAIQGRVHANVTFSR